MGARHLYDGDPVPELLKGLRLIRFIGFVVFLIGLLVLTLDVAAGVGGEYRFELRALGSWWAELDRESLLLLQPAVERYVTPAVWDPGIQTLLEWPAAPQFLILGSVLMLIGAWLRRRARRRRF
ncbi:MAG: hypothetical protein AAGA73_21785 [Pseudomonadota bacterium]